MPKRRAEKELWNAVRKIILDNYTDLIKHRIRESWYIVGDALAPMIGKEISQEQYHYFTGTPQGYSSYRDDIWPALEQKHGIERPRTKPYGTIYDHGSEYPISRLSTVWDQARGFIFTEKLEDGEDLRELSSYGWTIIAGGGFAGFPTREIRRLLKEDNRSILAFHDADNSGDGIYRALGFETRRTSHLDLALGDRVTDLGLTKDDAQKLELPTRPEPPKYKGQMRFETSGLARLEKRFGLQNPKLVYVIAKMLLLDLTLSPTEKARSDLLNFRLRVTIERAMADALNAAVDEAIAELDPRGDAVAVVVPEPENLDLKALFKGLAIKLGKSPTWFQEQEYHAEAARLTSSELVKLLEACR